MKQFPAPTVPGYLLIMSLLATGAASAGQDELDGAIKRYYAGQPDDAIGILVPLATSGDVDAQYLLGNIFYSLSKGENQANIDAAISWYRRAASQDSAAASYALGVIYQNRWQKSRERADAARAIAYYGVASDAGHTKAWAQLRKMESRTSMTRQQAARLAAQVETAPAAEPPARIATAEPSMPSTETIEAKSPEPETPEAETAEAGTISTVDAEPPADLEDAAANVTLTLPELAQQCGNYTEAGYQLYAETIRGALVSGSARITDFSTDTASPGSYLVWLSSDLGGVIVHVKLSDVPGDTARNLKAGDPHQFVGEIADTRTTATNCILYLTYRPTAG